MADPVIIGQDPIVRKVAKLSERLAHTTHPIFVEGEQGVGREHLARFLHARGPRAASPFSKIDFGDATRGSLIDALIETRRESAGGTLLIRHCEQVPAEEIGPVVSLLVEAEDSVRVVLSAGRREPGEVSGRAPDLVERIGALPLFLPPLRTRRADITELCGYLLERWAAESDRPGLGLSEEARVLLWRYDWPGNVRELRDELIAAAERSAGPTIGKGDLSPRLDPRSRRVGAGSRGIGRAGVLSLSV